MSDVMRLPGGREEDLAGTIRAPFQPLFNPTSRIRLWKTRFSGFPARLSI
jgi:hypothetical protein